MLIIASKPRTFQAAYGAGQCFKLRVALFSHGDDFLDDVRPFLFGVRLYFVQAVFQLANAVMRHFDIVHCGEFPPLDDFERLFFQVHFLRLSMLPNLFYCQDDFGDKVHDNGQAQKEGAVDVVNVHCRYN